MASNAEKITTVRIFNQTYKIKSGDDPAYVTALADIVDRKMNELSRHTPTVDSLKVAILAAMYIADDLHSLQKEFKGYAGEVESKVQLLVEQLAPVLEAEAGGSPQGTEVEGPCDVRDGK